MPVRRATSVSLPIELVDQARELGVNLSRAAEAGIAAALKQARTEAWQRENAEGIENYNRFIAENGLPLEEYRVF